MKIFLDDLRSCPKGFELCRTVKEAVALLKTGKVTLISFDHDLGDGPNGVSLANWIEFQVYLKRIPCPDWRVHSANPVGKGNIQKAMKAAKRFENKGGKSK